jgi:hypothetical protein
MQNHPRLHIVGSSPRSGTTLIFELVTACFDIEKWGNPEMGIFHGPAVPTRPYTSKMPMDLIHVSRLLRWDPMLHVVYMQRDPRDVVVSQHGMRPEEYWCDFPIWQRNEALMRRLRPHQRLLECRYEDLVADPDREQARLQAAFPFLKPLHAFSDFETVARTSELSRLALKGVRPISSGSVGTWKAHLPRIVYQLQQFPAMAQAVVDSGYADSPAWQEICAGVVPEATDSVRRDPLRGRSRLVVIPARIRRRLSTMWNELLYVLGRRKPI